MRRVLRLGWGWIALAIVVFAGWKPGRLLLGAYLFGGVTALQLNLQAASLSLLDVLTLIALIAAVVVILIGLIQNRRLTAKMLWWSASLCIAAAVFSFYKWLGWVFNETLWLSSSPYIATIFVLVIMSSGGAPGSLGKSFHASR